VPLLEMPRFQAGEVVEVRYGHPDKIKGGNCLWMGWKTPVVGGWLLARSIV
jgi:hypothetical protein